MPATSSSVAVWPPPGTKGGQKQVDAIAKGREARAVKSLEEAKSQGQTRGQGRPGVREGWREGRLFGAVSTADIAAAVARCRGPALDKRKIELPTPIRPSRVARGTRASAPGGPG